MLPGIPHIDQLEIERLFDTGAKTGATVFTIADRRRMFKLPKNWYTINETTKQISILQFSTIANANVTFNLTTGLGLKYYAIDDANTSIVIPNLGVNDTIIIRRKTLSEEKIVNFTAGSRLTSGQLNLSSNQLINIIQELLWKVDNEVIIKYDKDAIDGPFLGTFSGAFLDVTGNIDMNGQRITNLGYSGTLDDAMPKKEITDTVFRHGVITKDTTPTNTPGVQNDIIEGAANEGRSGVWFNPQDGKLRAWAGNNWVIVTNAINPAVNPFLVQTNTTQSISGQKTFLAPTTFDSTVTMTSNLAVTGNITTSGSLSSSSVLYTPSGAGAVARSAASKFGDVVSVKDFGAVGDGVADDTVALKAAFDYAIPLGRCVVLSGTYNITGPLQTTATRASGELHIYCDGAVTINVNAAATAFEYVLFIQTTAANNVSITGGSLYINCNQKAANGLYLRHLQTVTTAGTLNIECPVTIVNCKQNTASGNASGITVFGQYIRIDINDATVIGVERTAAGVCRGITVGLFDGEVTIRRPYIKNILCPASSLQDADGISVAGTQSGGDANLDYRKGRVVIESPTFVDCQGRGFKGQCSDVTVLSPTVFRQNVVTIANGYDFDFQFGGGTVRDAYLEYRLNGVTSPLGASFGPFAFQNRMQNKELCAAAINTTIVTDVAIPFVCSAFYSSTARSSTTFIDGVNIQPTSAIATNCLTDDVVRIGSVESTIVAMPGTATVRVRNVRGPIQSRIIGYDTYSGGAIASKLRVEVSDCFNTLPATSTNVILGVRSGSRILALDDFKWSNNHNWRNFIATTGPSLQDFDLAKLSVGTQITLGLNYLGTITNAPPWETGTDAKALVEVLATSQSFAGDKYIRVTTFPVTNPGRPKVFLSYDNATTWTQVGACAPVTKTADFTVAANEDVLINNKSGSACTVTLPAAASWTGRRILIKTIQAQAVNSASSNVVPLAGGAAGTAIVTGTAGKYAELVSDGTNWITMSGN